MAPANVNFFPNFPPPSSNNNAPPHYFPSPPNVPPPHHPITASPSPPLPATPPPPPHHHPTPPSPHYVPPPPSHALPPPPPPPRPHVLPPTPPPHALPPAPAPPPHAQPPPPGHHSTVIIVVFVSLGSLFFLAFLAAALFCFIKKGKKTVEKTDITEFDEHIKVQEAIVPGPHGEPTTVIMLEEDVHILEEIHKRDKQSNGSQVKYSEGHPSYALSMEATTSSGSAHHFPEHKP